MKIASSVASMRQRSKLLVFLVELTFLLSGCIHHQIAFQDIHYVITGEQYDKKVIAVIDTLTLKKEVPFRTAAAGLMHSWDAHPGEMLKQVADVELPQMFREYQFSTDYNIGPIPDKTIVLDMMVEKYQLTGLHATVYVRIRAYAQENKTIFDNLYIGEGLDQSGKVAWAGAFGMKSAIRQSSLDAYQKIFKALREDLRKEFDRPLPPSDLGS